MAELNQAQKKLGVVKTFCRICEAHCGLEATVHTNGEIKIKPDKSHPTTKGYVCIKGMSLGSLHTDPDRVNYPMKKVGNGWKQISWKQAISEIGAKTKALKKKYGSRCLGMYAGNPTFFNFKSILVAHEFIHALGSPNLFSSHSIDVNNKLYIRMKMYGSSVVTRVPDLKRTHFLMCLGTNPMVSQMSVFNIANAVGKLQDIEKRGGKVVIIDPRRTETADKVGDHVFIRPGTDIYLLLAMLNIFIETQKPNLDKHSEVAKNLEACLELARKWTPSKAAVLTGIPEDKIRQLTQNFMQAKGAAIYMSTGVNMGPFGAHAFWIAECLLFLSGNLDRKGGVLFGHGPFDTLALAQELGLGQEDEYATLKHGMKKVAGCFPSNTLADEILIDHPERIRALFVTSGNPVHAIPGSDLKAAMKALELVVCVDIYHSDTVDYADYLLPATDMLERSDIPMGWLTNQADPHLQYTKAVVPAKHERREEWEIFQQLAVACGAPAFANGACNNLAHINHWLSKIPFGDMRITPDKILKKLINEGGILAFNDLLENPQGVAMPEYKENNFIGKRVLTDDGKVDFGPQTLRDDLHRLDKEARRLLSEDGLLLIGKRDRRTHNSWMHNVPDINHPDTNHVIMHPDDARNRNIGEGDQVSLSGAKGGQISLPVLISDEVMPGVIVVPHGWGQKTKAQRKAYAMNGENINDIIPGGSDHMDMVSGQAIMLSHKIKVERLENTL